MSTSLRKGSDTDVTILHGFISGLGFGRVVASTASLARMCLRLLPTWKVVSSQLDPIQICCSYKGVALLLGNSGEEA